ncbi:hypothetical protein ABPG72_013346 [Tetrahymena utriculariae]
MSTMVNFPKYSHCTLLFVQQANNILLGMKKRGFGANLWNGFGGKVDFTETIRQAAIRETQEECGITPINPKFVGLIKFNMNLDQKTIIVHVFKTTEYTGNLTESEEMLPQWFDVDKINYDAKWPDDRIWYPDMLSGNNLFFGEYDFQEHSVITSSNHKIVKEEELLALQKELSKIRLE